MCGDYRHDLNYPEIPDSWNNKEKTTMTNFNEKVNSGIGYSLNSQEFFIYRTRTINEFARMIHDELYLLTNPYCLFIQYKTTHRAKKMAGRCFLWDNSHGDHMADPGNGIELRSMNDASQDDCEGFGNPRFDCIESAILIADQYVIMYGDVKIEADSIRRDKKHVICTVSLCGSLVSYFRIPAEVFDRHFGLKENFLKRNDKECECVEVSFADSEEGEQDEANEKTTECAACEKLSKENGDDTYHRNLFGCEFFDTSECQRDIDRVKIGVESVISLMHEALRKLDEAQDDVGRHTELTDDAQLLLRESELVIDDAMGSALAASNDVANLFWKACKYKRTDSQNTI